MNKASDNTQPVFVLIGATGGIGSALARRLAADNAALVLGGRDEKKLLELAGELKATPFVLDATNTAQVEECVKHAVQHYGKIDGLANCVGSLLIKPLHLTSDTEWDNTIATNLRSAFATVRAGVQAMMRTGGAIVLCSTAASLAGLASHEAIAAAKGGVNGLTVSAAATYASRGIRVNAVAPGLTRTPLTKQLTGNAMLLKGATAMHALGRIGEPEEVAALIAWLLHPANSWMTGQVIGIDGGLSTVRTKSAA